MSYSFATEARQSEMIRAMRFPLIVLVLYAHSIRPEGLPMYWNTDGESIFRIVTELFSHYIGGLALCWFFFLSGFLFFYNLQDGQYGKEWVTRKWRRRLRSVLIPYVVWNLIMVLAVILVSTLFQWVGISYSQDPVVALRRGWVYWFITGPIDFPLWYLRDLVVLSLLAPLFYYPVKKCPWITMAVLLGLYLATFLGLKFFLFPSFTFFGIGAWMSIRKDNLIELCYRYRMPAAILSVFLLAGTLMHYNLDLDNNFFLLFAPFGMVTFFNICYSWYKCPRIRKGLLGLTETVFFIYAAHEIYILGWTKGLFVRVLGDALWAQWVSYLLVPVVTLFVCLLLFYALKRFAPRTLAFLCGFRTVHTIP